MSALQYLMGGIHYFCTAFLCPLAPCMQSRWGRPPGLNQSPTSPNALLRILTVIFESVDSTVAAQHRGASGPDTRNCVPGRGCSVNLENRKGSYMWDVHLGPPIHGYGRVIRTAHMRCAVQTHRSVWASLGQSSTSQWFQWPQPCFLTARCAPLHLQ